MSIQQWCQIDDAQGKTPVPLQRRLWLAYLRAAIVPLLVIELGFLAIFWFSNSFAHRDNIATVRSVSRDLLIQVARQAADGIEQEMAGYAAKTRLLSAQTARALEGNFVPSREEWARHRFDPNGSIYSIRDLGGIASFYSSATRPSRTDLAEMLRLASIDTVMVDIKRSTPGVTSVYFNSARSYNRIHPYINAGSQYPPAMNIPAYNFYYEADERHNPQRDAVWTDAYFDPAGNGWMISSIAPVWSRGRLAGVVGLDIGLGAIINRLQQIDLPWKGYAVLTDLQGRIIALPPEGETDFKLRELTTNRHPETVERDRFKPAEFDLNLRTDTRALAEAMRRSSYGNAEITFDGTHYASFATIPGPGWRLIVIAPANAINAPVDELRERLSAVALAMLAGFLLFYIGFFMMLYRRSRQLSAELLSPMNDLSQLIQRIGEGDHRQVFAGAEILEFDRLGRDLTGMGNRLGDAHERIVEQEQGLREAHLRQQQVNEQNARLIQIMSHELRTPLALIDSGAQIIDRKADDLAPEDLRNRARKMREAVRRIIGLIEKLVASLTPVNREDAASGEGPLPVVLAPLVEAAIASFEPERITLGQTDAVAAIADPEAVSAIVRGLLDNAARYSDGAGAIRVDVIAADGIAEIVVEDHGPGLIDEDLAQTGQLFFRGRNASGSDGAGVSLHLARRYLAQVGGRLEIERGAAGGLRVKVILPSAEEQA